MMLEVIIGIFILFIIIKIGIKALKFVVGIGVLLGILYLLMNLL